MRDSVPYARRKTRTMRRRFPQRRRPNTQFLAIESEAHRPVLTVHRARTLMVANRTAQVSQIRRLLGEFGL